MKDSMRKAEPSFVPFVRHRRICAGLAVAALSCGAGLAQSVPVPNGITEPFPMTAGELARPAATSAANYVLGPEDQITIRGMDIEEIADKPFRVDAGGMISLPLVGRIRAAGLTLEGFERDLRERLQKFVRNPQFAVNVHEFKSNVVSILGAVGNPGTHHLQGPRTLLELISQVGGLRPECGSTIKITRRMEYGPIPLAEARTDLSGKFSVAELPLSPLTNSIRPQDNIQVMPHDVISIPRGELIYVLGDVRKSGGFLLQSREKPTVLQAIAMAEGTIVTAARSHTRILRRAETANMARTEIKVNLDQIMAGKAPDVPLQPEDILLVPNNKVRAVGIRAAEAALQITTGLVIWRR